MARYIQSKEEKLGMLLQLPLVWSLVSFDQVVVYLVHETKRGQNIPNCGYVSTSIPVCYC
jgi:hypothetical protein